MKVNCALAVLGLHDDVGADDIGRHQVGRELDPAEFEDQAAARVRIERGLAQSRHAFEQRMAADEQAGQHAVDDLFMADDDLGDLGEQLGNRGGSRRRVAEPVARWEG